MKTHHTLFLLLLSLAFAGCFDITEEIWLNKNRSGRYEVTFSLNSGPMATLLRMAQMKANDSLRALGKPPQNLDTLVRLADLPDSLRPRFPHPDLLAQTSVRIKFDKSLECSFLFDFAKIEDVARFWANLDAFDKMKEDSALKSQVPALKAAGMGSFKGMLSSVPHMQFDGKTLRREMKTDTVAPEAGPSLFDLNDESLAKMIFRNKNYRLLFHLPKKVKSVRGEGFRHEDKTVQASFPMLEVSQHQKQLSCEIELK